MPMNYVTQEREFLVYRFKFAFFNKDDIALEIGSAARIEQF